MNTDLLAAAVRQLLAQEDSVNAEGVIDDGLLLQLTALKATVLCDLSFCICDMHNSHKSYRIPKS
jgi:hypothetical protein